MQALERAEGGRVRVERRRIALGQPADEVLARLAHHGQVVLVAAHQVGAEAARAERGEVDLIDAEDVELPQACAR
jgi:hypothetical protein